VIVTDSVFSMDGTVADLASLLTLARAHSAWLVVDDAHATGVLGPAGAGAWAAAGLAPDPQVVLTGSLSKAFGAQGGFIAGTSSLRDLVLNLGRAIIFSTALSPALAGAALEAIRVSGDEPWRRENAVARARQLRDALGVESPLQHPIVPFVLGDPGRAVDVARRLREGGFAVSAVRPPSVPHGTSRLRLTTTAAHTREHIEALAGAVRAAAGATQPLPVV
jgi:8-amino-7-oxononanoate synthase